MEKRIKKIKMQMMGRDMGLIEGDELSTKLKSVAADDGPDNGLMEQQQETNGQQKKQSEEWPKQGQGEATDDEPDLGLNDLSTKQSVATESSKKQRVAADNGPSEQQSVTMLITKQRVAADDEPDDGQNEQQSVAGQSVKQSVAKTELSVKKEEQIRTSIDWKNTVEKCKIRQGKLKRRKKT